MVVALTLGQAETIAVLIVVGLAVAAVLSAWLMKEITQKIVLVLILCLLALLVWTQRSSLQDCANGVREQTRGGVGTIDTTCTFFGQDITISTG